MQNDYDPALGQAAEALAKKWHTSDLMAIGSQGPKGASPSDIKDWSSDMLVAFLDKLASYRAKQPMHKQTTRQMAQLYRLDDSKNSEIKGSWYKLAINAGVLLLPTVLLNHKILLPHIVQRAVDLTAPVLSGSLHKGDQKLCLTWALLDCCHMCFFISSICAVLGMSASPALFTGRCFQIGLQRVKRCSG